MTLGVIIKTNEKVIIRTDKAKLNNRTNQITTDAQKAFKINDSAGIFVYGNSGINQTPVWFLIDNFKKCHKDETFSPALFFNYLAKEYKWVTLKCSVTPNQHLDHLFSEFFTDLDQWVEPEFNHLHREIYHYCKKYYHQNTYRDNQEKILGSMFSVQDAMPPKINKRILEKIHSKINFKYPYLSDHSNHEYKLTWIALVNALHDYICYTHRGPSSICHLVMCFKDNNQWLIKDYAIDSVLPFFTKAWNVINDNKSNQPTGLYTYGINRDAMAFLTGINPSVFKTIKSSQNLIDNALISYIDPDNSMSEITRKIGNQKMFITGMNDEQIAIMDGLVGLKQAIHDNLKQEADSQYNQIMKKMSYWSQDKLIKFAGDLITLTEKRQNYLHDDRGLVRGLDKPVVLG